jgi:predicted small lipoprotein YifL
MIMKARVLLALVLAGLAASGCGLKGPLYLPEKSEVTIRPAPKPPAEAAAPEQEQAKPEQPVSPEQPPQDPQPGPDRG